jgi:AtzE family amidohydrolase
MTVIDVVATAEAIRTGSLTACKVIESTLDRIRCRDSELNSFTSVTSERAVCDAEAVDTAVAEGRDPGPLAGVPFAVKDLLDIQGLPTLAGSRIGGQEEPATVDAASVAQLRQAGAVLVGALNMDEYACGFTTENTHYGPTRNPRDITRIAGGSSGGSAAAVAGGLVPFSLGSDTNGSIRIPAALCGIYGLKPTYGRISRSGAKTFGMTLDHIGPLAASVRDLASVYDVLQDGYCKRNGAAERPPEACIPRLADGTAGLRIAVADDYFVSGCEPNVGAALAKVAGALDATQKITINESHRARAAAMLITFAEGSSLHMADLKTRLGDFDPMTQDWFLAAALVPAAHYVAAQRFREWYRRKWAEIFSEIDVVLTPTTPYAAPRIGQTMMNVAGVEVEARPNLGRYTQPLSLIGLPVMSVPVSMGGHLPLGVQLVAAPWNEPALFRVAAALERDGVIGTQIPV